MSIVGIYYIFPSIFPIDICLIGLLIGCLYLNIAIIIYIGMHSKERYSRQELVLGRGAQRKLSTAHVAIIGVGALGSATAELLCRAGVGKLLVIDRDVVEESNLQRQVLYTEADISKPKAEAAAQRLKK
jgi:molybdopterin/thiamine biosynthesis adenylyltransferase